MKHDIVPLTVVDIYIKHGWTVTKETNTHAEIQKPIEKPATLF